ncbi:hypothetical protein J4Q44_G00306170 [Coregonus suidteri]|uniref:Uncharacterized protein n=1 Tax=Coregonus suidteri TaxID=861788 RepID=A0AAN8QRF9_9TELE
MQFMPHVMPQTRHTHQREEEERELRKLQHMGKKLQQITDAVIEELRAVAARGSAAALNGLGATAAGPVATHTCQVATSPPASSAATRTPACPVVTSAPGGSSASALASSSASQGSTSRQQCNSLHSSKPCGPQQLPSPVLKPAEQSTSNALQTSKPTTECLSLPHDGSRGLSRSSSRPSSTLHPSRCQRKQHLSQSSSRQCCSLPRNNRAQGSRDVARAAARPATASAPI